MNRADHIAKIRACQMPGAKPGTQAPGKLIHDDYIYTHAPVTLSQVGGSWDSAQASAFITIDAEGDFAILQRVSSIYSDQSLNDGGAWYSLYSTIPVLVQLQDGSSGRVLSDVVYLSDFAGAGQVPFSLGQIKKFASRQSFRLNYSMAPGWNVATSSITVQTAFVGRKIFH